jgi:hypothetical protein
MTEQRAGGRYRCPACGADLVSIDGYPPTPRSAVFVCGSNESRILGHYRFLQTPDCAAIAEEASELDDPAAEQR